MTESLYGTVMITILSLRHMQIVFKANGNCEKRPTIEYNGEVPSPGVLTYVCKTHVMYSCTDDDSYSYCPLAFMHYVDL